MKKWSLLQLYRCFQWFLWKTRLTYREACFIVQWFSSGVVGILLPRGHSVLSRDISVVVVTDDLGYRCATDM